MGIILRGMAPGGLVNWGGTAKFTLEITAPRSTLNANHRMRRAYTGLTYSIPTIVHGGVYPFRFSLSGEPTGMTINTSTGVITWTNPTSSSGTITVTVEDSTGATDSETWSVTVGTSGYKFVDAINGNDTTGTGAIGAPWATIDKLFDNDAENDITYFRTGVYNTTGLPSVNPGVAGDFVDVEYNGAAGRGHSTIWLAYPGDSPEIDFLYNGSNHPPYLKFNGPYIYFDGFECYNEEVKCFSATAIDANTAPVCWRCHFHTGGPGGPSLNAGFFMTESNNYAFAAYGGGVLDCDFDDADHNALKLYSLDKFVVDRCTFDDNGGIEEKAYCKRFTVRSCTFNNIAADAGAVGGNLNDNNAGGDKSTGEICFCLFRNCARSAIEIGEGWTNSIGPIYTFRNTIVAVIRIVRLDAPDGIHTFERNVIVNADGAQTPFPFMQDTTINDSSRLTANISSNPELSPTGVENLAGASGDSIVDAGGLLQGTYRTNFLHSWGHEVP